MKGLNVVKDPGSHDQVMAADLVLNTRYDRAYTHETDNFLFSYWCQHETRKSIAAS